MNQHDEKPKSLSMALEDHSAEGIAILSSEPSRLISAIIYIMFGALLAGLVWSFFGRADVIVNAQGKLGPEFNERRVYTPIDGELVDVYIAEGMPVSEGDILARINATGAIEAANRALTAELKLQEAEAAYRIFPSQKRTMEQKLEALKLRLEAAEQAQAKRVLESMEKLGEEQKLRLEEARLRLDSALNELNFAKQEWEKYNRLYKSAGGGGVSRQEVEKRKVEYQSKLKAYELAKTELGQFEVTSNREFVKRREENQAKIEELRDLQAQYEEQKIQIETAENEIETKLRLAQIEAAAAAQVTFDDIDEENFLRVKAPASGVITNVAYTQVGEKVQAQTALAGIAPENARTVLHIEIQERDRAFLREGMPVKMKFNAFPYQRYGFINGTLEYISPAAVGPQDSPEGGALIYKGRISLERSHFEVEDIRIPLRYGMTATAEVVVRKRRLIDLALDPFRRVRG